jgi:hypothetical protein
MRVVALRSLHSGEGGRDPSGRGTRRISSSSMLDSRIDWGATSRLQNVVEDAGREVIQDHCVTEFRRIRRPTLPKGNVTEKPRGDSLRAVLSVV